MILPRSHRRHRLRSARTEILNALFVVLALCSQASSQSGFEVIGGGCTVPSGGTPGVPEATDPDEGNEFEMLSLSFTCPLGSNTMFILFGKCLKGPEYPLFAPTPCGSACGQRIDSSGIMIDGRKLIGRVKLGELALPIPSVPDLAGTTLCFQFVCFRMSDQDAQCREISQAVEIELR